jgi:PAS domain S-box-containing protein
MSAEVICAPENLAWAAAAIPADEGERLAALRGLEILDTAPTEAFDTVTQLAASTLRVPIVLVSLVDENRQWFKSRVGLEAAQTGREESFCAHAVFDRRPLIVRDASRDPRFAGNPLVAGPLHFRAYMGVPLFTASGCALGALCAIDVEPREFSDTDLATLRGFAAIVEEFLRATQLARHGELVAAELSLQTRRVQSINQALQKEVKKAIEAERALCKAEHRSRAIADNLPVLIGYWNDGLWCESANEAYRALYGLAPEAIVGMSMQKLMGETEFQLNEPRARAALDGHAQRFDRSVVKADGSRAHLDARYLPDTDETGYTRGFYMLETDVTDLRLAEQALRSARAGD